jgi:DNA uptake protein ComE-like DNA-binding protein
MSKRMMHNIIAIIIVFCVIIFFRLYEPPLNKTNADIHVDTTNLANEHNSIQHEIAAPKYPINPNTASLEELLQAGFTKQQAFTCIKYRNAGGVFRYKDDIAKLYTVSAEDYKNLQAYIDLPEKLTKNKEQKKDFEQQKSEKWTKSEPKQYEKKQITKRDLNSIDSAELIKIPYIGAFRAHKILEARKKWGGFYSMAQIESLYSFDSAACANVAKYCYIDITNIRRINLNACSFKEIQQLPASSYYIAKNICDYKKIVGSIQNTTELVENNIVEREKFEILRHYVKTN